MNIYLRLRVWSAPGRVFLLSGLWAFFVPLCCQAQQNKLAVSPPEQITARRGATAVEKLKVTVLDGFHVNSDKPKEEYLIPLKLTWTGGPLEAKSITYPKPEQVKVGSDVLNVFTGHFDITSEFAVPSSAVPGSGTLTGKLRYQACNSDMCFRPATVDVKVPVVIE